MADAFVVILINVMNKEDFYRIYSDLVWQKPSAIKNHMGFHFSTFNRSF